MPDYKQVTTADFDKYLLVCLERFTAEMWLAIPGVYEIVAAEFNNDVLDAWAADNPELAYPEDYAEAEDAEEESPTS